MLFLSGAGTTTGRTHNARQRLCARMSPAQQTHAHDDCMATLVEDGPVDVAEADCMMGIRVGDSCWSYV